IRHVCWDGCMFANEVMMKPDTWNDILAAMIAVRDAHGWREDDQAGKAAAPRPFAVKSRPRPAKKAGRAPAKPARKPVRKPAKRSPVRVTAKKKSRSARAVKKS